MKENGAKGGSSRALRMGGFSTLLVVIAIVIGIVVNLLVAKIPSKYIKIDNTSSKIFSISEQTQKIVGSLKQDVTVYLIAQTGSEASAITEMLDRYESLSDKLHIEYRDPVLYPGFTTQFTDQTVTSNSLVVVSDKRSKVVPYSSIVTTTTEIVDGSYQQATVFDGENQLTGAIDYVTSDVLPKIYILTGHGEQSIPSSFQNSISGQNIETDTLNLLTANKVPEDADAVLMYCPTADITEEDMQKLTDYMQGGGNLLLITHLMLEPQPNIAAFVETYGLKAVDGLVIEGDANHTYYGYPNYLVPDLKSHAITDPLIKGNRSVLYADAQGIDISADKRDTLTVTPLIKTSDKAYSKIDVKNMTSSAKEAGDIDGPFNLAVAVEDTKYNGKLVWFTTYMLLDEQIDALVSGGNTNIFLNSLAWMCQRESSITIHPKSLTMEYLDISTENGRALNIFFMGLLPLASIVTGGVVWYKRKKR
ncbi:MAG: GldG family protein [Oscillospiraceae bacterium]|jgi:ABC-2 type transport system permease protein